MVLSNEEILRHREEGNIIIEPFDIWCVNTSSVDVRLGSWHFREEAPRDTSRAVFNIYSEEDVHRVWGKPQQAVKNSDPRMKIPGISPEKEIIMLAPGETILGHTEEFIGGQGCLTTNMHARSSLGRVFIAVCKCAGWGDVGYVIRWTMEITNFSTHYYIPLVVGMRIAQIVFHEVAPVTRDYGNEGKYQSGTDINQLIEEWKPEMMLPQLYNDREIR